MVHVGWHYVVRSSAGLVCTENQVVKIPNLSSLVAPETITTTCGAAKDENASIVTNVIFQSEKNK